MEATLLLYVWIRQDQDINHIGAGEPHLYLGILGNGDPYQHPSATTGGWLQDQPVPIKHTGH